MVEDDNMKNKRTATIGSLLRWLPRAFHDERRDTLSGRLSHCFPKEQLRSITLRLTALRVPHRIMDTL